MDPNEYAKLKCELRYGFIKQLVDTSRPAETFDIICIHTKQYLKLSVDEILNPVSLNVSTCDPAQNETQCAYDQT